MTITSMKAYFGLAIVASFLGGTLQAQVDLKFATYGTDSPTAGMAPVTGTTNTLGPVTVTQIYTASSGYTYNFISDASGVSNYVYIPPGGPALTVGASYTGLTLDSSPFGSATNGYNFEMTLDASNAAAALVPTTTGITPAYTPVSEGLLTTVSGMTDNYSATPPGDIQPVQFTFTAPTSTTVTPVTGNYTAVDPNNSDSINFYRPTNGLTFVANTTYTIDGYAFVYRTGTEIYDPSIVTAPAPEPSTFVLLGFAGLIVVFTARKARAGSRQA